MTNMTCRNNHNHRKGGQTEMPAPMASGREERRIAALRKRRITELLTKLELT